MIVYSKGEFIKDIDNFKVMFKTRNWSIVQGIKEGEGKEEGPSMYHILCKTLTYILSQNKARCYGCDRPIPSRIQVVYTMLNFEKGDNPCYFQN